jgi:hypothetical protein
MKLEHIASEYRGARLGDRRRTRRLERIACELARNPGLSFPEAMGTEGQLEGLYRFLNNDEVSFEAVQAPHAQQTRVRCQAHDRVLAISPIRASLLKSCALARPGPTWVTRVFVRVTPCCQVLTLRRHGYG